MVEWKLIESQFEKGKPFFQKVKLCKTDCETESGRSLCLANERWKVKLVTVCCALCLLSVFVANMFDLLESRTQWRLVHRSAWLDSFDLLAFALFQPLEVTPIACSIWMESLDFELRSVALFANVLLQVCARCQTTSLNGPNCVNPLNTLNGLLFWTSFLTNLKRLIRIFDCVQAKLESNGGKKQLSSASQSDWWPLKDFHWQPYLWSS